MQKRTHTGNPVLFLIGSAIYVGLLILFGWQTWQFVDWLFPGDQLMMKLLTVLCFDVMALFWACADLFYRFATKGARTLVRSAWAVSFIFSLLASIFYLVIESMFRFQVTITPATVNIGYGITIFALTLNILFLTFWIYLEWSARHPHQDDYLDAQPPVLPSQDTALAQPGHVQVIPAPVQLDERMISLIAQAVAERTGVQDALPGKWQTLPSMPVVQGGGATADPLAQNGNGKHPTP